MTSPDVGTFSPNSVQRALIATLTIFVFFLGLYSILLSVAVWARFHVDIPVFDTVIQLPLIRSAVGGESVPFSDWIAAHAGAHRIFFVRFFMFLDYRFFDGGNDIIYLSSWASLGMILAVFLKASLAQRGAGAWMPWFALGLISAVLMAPGQYWNILNPINSSWIMALALSAVGIWLFLSAGDNLSYWRALLISVAMTFAVFACFAGVIGALVLLGLTVLHRSRPGGLIALLVLGLVAFSLLGIETSTSKIGESEEFIRAVEELQAKNPELRQTSIFDAAVFRIALLTALHLGTPFAADNKPLALILMMFTTLGLIAAWIHCLVVTQIGKRHYPAWAEFFLAMATVCLGVSLATWMGRVIFVQPNADRYQTVTLVFWLSVACLLLSASQTGRGVRYTLPMLLALTTGAGVVALGNVSNPIQRIADMKAGAVKLQILKGVGVKGAPGAAAILPIGHGGAYMTHIDFLSDYGAFALPDNFDIPTGGNRARCDALSVRRGKGGYRGVSAISLEADAGLAWYDSLYVIEKGKAVGELYGIYDEASGASLSALTSAPRKWEGFYQGGARAPGLRLLVTSPTGSSIGCPIK